MLSLENASIDRMVSRIDHTPIREVRERLKQHLEETLIQKDRLVRIITELGGKTTNTKEDKDRSESKFATISQTKNFAKIMKLTEDPSGDNSVPEEDELAEIKQDYIIEHDELVAYESLISKMQTMNIAHHMIRSLERSMQEEESMAYWYKVHTALILDSLWPKMIYRSIRRGQRFLLNHVSSKIPLIVMYADLVGSTSMSMTLPVDQLVVIIRAFTHHISRVVDGFDGYVLKYVGDAVMIIYVQSIARFVYTRKINQYPRFFNSLFNQSAVM
jgi:ferritin-like metal-binding protein YciE